MRAPDDMKNTTYLYWRLHTTDIICNFSCYKIISSFILWTFYVKYHAWYFSYMVQNYRSICDCCVVEIQTKYIFFEQEMIDINTINYGQTVRIVFFRNKLKEKSIIFMSICMCTYMHIQLHIFL